jgi:hypothetical protein
VTGRTSLHPKFFPLGGEIAISDATCIAALDDADFQFVKQTTGEPAAPRLA